MFLVGGEWLGPGEATVLLTVLALATVGTAVVFLIALLAYRRRRTDVYLLVTIALGLLVGRSIVGFGTALGVVPMPAHHLIEHGSDFGIATLLLYALYRAGRLGPGS